MFYPLNRCISKSSITAHAVMKLYIVFIVSRTMESWAPGAEPKGSSQSGTSLADNQPGCSIRKPLLQLWGHWIKYKVKGENMPGLCRWFGAWEEVGTAKVAGEMKTRVNTKCALHHICSSNYNVFGSFSPLLKTKNKNMQTSDVWETENERLWNKLLRLTAKMKNKTGNTAKLGKHRLPCIRKTA